MDMNVVQIADSGGLAAPLDAFSMQGRRQPSQGNRAPKGAPAFVVSRGGAG